SQRGSRAARSRRLAASAHRHGARHENHGRRRKPRLPPLHRPHPVREHRDTTSASKRRYRRVDEGQRPHLGARVHPAPALGLSSTATFEQYCNHEKTKIHENTKKTLELKTKD